MKEKGRLIKLEIDMEYPLSWDFPRVCRDLVQNFLDSSQETFAEDFRLGVAEMPGGSLIVTMEMAGRPFSYDYLTYIGGSTKTGHDGRYAGKYGEGFKMCMLQLVKDGYGDISMESGSWRISPCTYGEAVDGCERRMLGYRLTERADDGMTRLTIRGVPSRYRQTIEDMPLEFFYPGNPLFGEKLCETEHYSVYGRSGVPIPDREHDAGFRGILYCNFLARGRLDFPLIVHVRGNLSRYDTRKRKTFTRSEVVSILGGCSYGFDPRASYVLLLGMEKFWGDLPKRTFDASTWYYTVCQLVRNISSDPTLAAEFAERFPGLAYIERKNRDKNHDRTVDAAKRWAAGRAKDYSRLVNPVFRLLGARSLVGEYRALQMGRYRAPTPAERRRTDLLFRFTEALFRDGFLYDERPEVMVADGGGEPQKIDERDCTKGPRRYRILTLVLGSGWLASDDFHAVWTGFVSALLGAYGTERSRNKTGLLTELGEMFVEHRERIAIFGKEWSDA